MNDKKIIKLIFTALMPIFWSMYSIQGVQLDTLTQVDHIQLACADDQAELTVLRVVDRVGFVGKKHHFSNE